MVNSKIKSKLSYKRDNETHTDSLLLILILFIMGSTIYNHSIFKIQLIYEYYF